MHFNRSPKKRRNPQLKEHLIFKAVNPSVGTTLNQPPAPSTASSSYNVFLAVTSRGALRGKSERGRSTRGGNEQTKPTHAGELESRPPRNTGPERAALSNRRGTPSTSADGSGQPPNRRADAQTAGGSGPVWGAREKTPSWRGLSGSCWA